MLWHRYDALCMRPVLQYPSCPYSLLCGTSLPASQHRILRLRSAWRLRHWRPMRCRVWLHTLLCLRRCWYVLLQTRLRCQQHSPSSVAALHVLMCDMRSACRRRCCSLGWHWRRTPVFVTSPAPCALRAVLSRSKSQCTASYGRPAPVRRRRWRRRSAGHCTNQNLGWLCTRFLLLSQCCCMPTEHDVWLPVRSHGTWLPACPRSARNGESWLHSLQSTAS